MLTGKSKPVTAATISVMYANDCAAGGQDRIAPTKRESIITLMARAQTRTNRSYQQAD